MNNAKWEEKYNEATERADFFKPNTLVIPINSAILLTRMLLTESTAQALAEDRERVVWVKYKDKKPVIGQLVIFYRDIESRQIIATKWTKEEENYAEMNEITHWMPIEYPDLLSSLDTNPK